MITAEEARALLASKLNGFKPEDANKIMELNNKIRNASSEGLDFIRLEKYDLNDVIARSFESRGFIVDCESQWPTIYIKWTFDAPKNT